MDVYGSDQEQVEELKKWWKENGTAIVVGLALGLGGLFGWRYWQGHVKERQGAASLGFQQVVANVKEGRFSDARQAGDMLLEKYDDTAYAGMAALMLARAAVEEGKLDEARARLEWAVKHAKKVELRDLARQRLARTLLAQGKFDEAWSALSGLESTAPAIVKELQGDIRAAQGKTEEARALYQQAMGAAQQYPEGDPTPLQLKLEDLGTAPGATPAAASGS